MLGHPYLRFAWHMSWKRMCVGLCFALCERTDNSFDHKILALESLIKKENRVKWKTRVIVENKSASGHLSIVWHFSSRLSPHPSFVPESWKRSSCFSQSISDISFRLFSTWIFHQISSVVSDISLSTISYSAMFVSCQREMRDLRVHYRLKGEQSLWQGVCLSHGTDMRLRFEWMSE